MKILLTAFFIFFGTVVQADEDPLELSFYGSFVHSVKVPNALFFFSEIKDNDAFELRRALRAHDIQVVVLLSGGGSVWESLIMAGILFDRGIDTYVPDLPFQHGCYSACALMFFAGRNRIADGILAVHQIGFYNPELDNLERRQAETQQATQFTASEIIGFLNEFRTPPWVFERMFRSRSLHFFSDDEKMELSTGVLESEIRLSVDDFLQTFLKPPNWANATRVEIKGHKGALTSAAFSPNGQWIVTASVDDTARIWASDTGSEIATLSGHQSALWSASFSPDGQQIVTASIDRTARVWDVITGRSIAILGHASALYHAAFSPNGRQIITGSADGTARIWDVMAEREVITLSAHARGVWAAAFSPSGERVVTGGNDETARIWDAETGREIAVLRGHSSTVSSAAFSPDGRWIVTASHDGTARIWDAETGQEIDTLIEYTSRMWSAAFSFDGRLIVTGAEDGAVHILDAVDGREIGTLQELSLLSSVAFSPNGLQIVAAGSNDKTARIWTSQ